MSDRYQEGYVQGHRKGLADCEAEIERLRAALRDAINIKITDSNGREVEEDSIFEMRKIIGRALA